MLRQKCQGDGQLRRQKSQNRHEFRRNTPATSACRPGRTTAAAATPLAVIPGLMWSTAQPTKTWVKYLLVISGRILTTTRNLWRHQPTHRPRHQRSRYPGHPQRISSVQTKPQCKRSHSANEATAQTKPLAAGAVVAAGSPATLHTADLVVSALPGAVHVDGLARNVACARAGEERCHRRDILWIVCPADGNVRRTLSL